MDDGMLDDLLARRDAPIKALARALIAIVSRAAPGLSGKVQPGWGSVNFTHRRAGYVCAVLPQSRDVLIVFQHGRELSHPRLEDNGLVKKVRWIRFLPGETPDEDDLAILIAEAIALRA